MSIKNRIEKLESRDAGLVLIITYDDETHAEAIRRHEEQTGQSVTGKRVLFLITGVPRRDDEA